MVSRDTKGTQRESILKNSSTLVQQPNIEKVTGQSDALYTTKTTKEFCEESHNYTRRHWGNYIEAESESWLSSQGLQCVERNYHTRFGEIDRIYREDELIIFCEVKYREESRYGHGRQHVHTKKQKKIIRSAQSYLLRSKLNQRFCRFDVVEAYKAQGMLEMIWLRDAFRLPPIRP